MKIAEKLLSGVLYVGLIGAASFGIILYLAVIFGAGTPLWARILTSVIIVGLFAIGYAEGGGKSGATDEEDEDSAV